MRRSILTALLLAGAMPASADPVYVSIGADGVRTAFEVASTDRAAISVQRMNTPIAVLQIDERELEPLSALMHERLHRCGGFLVHDSLAEALAEPVPVRTTVDYTLDRGDVVRAVLPAIREPEILSTIRALSSRKNRYYRSESGADVSKWLAHRWRGFSDRTDVDVALFDQGYPQKSVILTIRGTTRPDEVVIIGGHLDSIAVGGNASNAPGADDDASGIATLDHVAHTLLAAGYRPERTVQFMAYAAEEVGLRGSQAIARDYKKRGVHVVGVLQLDMTNYQGSDRDIWLIDDFTSPAQNRFVAELIERYTKATWGVDRCGYACSDHASWHRIGVPASMPHETRSRDRNKHIHTARDTLEVSGDNAAHAVKFAQLGAAYAIELAKGTLAPDVRAASAAGDGVCGDHPGWKLAALLLALATLAAARFSDPSRP
ncbi:MAG TPA: M20/M25/M40 family metallo-hydrolase [Kofleriaceae bacterium]|nr:M20/M25/M40 family metallo-hydrolase [Kofleriaceae bacterium]